MTLTEKHTRLNSLKLEVYGKMTKAQAINVIWSEVIAQGLEISGHAKDALWITEGNSHRIITINHTISEYESRVTLSASNSTGCEYISAIPNNTALAAFLIDIFK